MMNANEARIKTNELLKADDNKRMEDLRAWVEETCGKAIEEAVEARRFEVVVDVPNKHNTSDVASELRDKGFVINICWGNPTNRITISWRKN